jgi:hypothetical protein
MQVSTLTRSCTNNAMSAVRTNAEAAVSHEALRDTVELSESPKRPSLMTLNLNVRPEIKVEAKPPETGYSNVTDLKSLREERDKKAEEMRIFRQALAGGQLIDAVETEINKVAYLSDRPANKRSGDSRSTSLLAGSGFQRDGERFDRFGV